MAMIVTEQGKVKIVRDTQTAIDCFMIFSGIEWHELMTRDLRGSKEPWTHPSLELFDAREPVSQNLKDWKKILLAIIDERGLADNRPRNIIFPKVCGHICFYWAYVSDNGIVKANCMKPNDFPEVQQAMTRYLAKHPGFSGGRAKRKAQYVYGVTPRME